MEAFAIRDLREHTGALVRNAEDGRLSVVSKHGKRLFVAVPFTDALLSPEVSVSLADKLVQSGELSVAWSNLIQNDPTHRACPRVLHLRR